MSKITLNLTQILSVIFNIGLEIVCFLMFMKHIQILLLPLLIPYGIVLSPINPLLILAIILIINFLFNANGIPNLPSQDKCFIFKNTENTLLTKMAEAIKAQNTELTVKLLEDYKTNLMLDRFIHRAVNSLVRYGFMFVIIKLILYTSGIGG